MPALEHIAPITFDGRSVAHVAPFGYSSIMEHVARQGLSGGYALPHVAPYSLTEAGRVAHTGKYDLLTNNPATTAHTASWGLLQSSVVVRTQRPFITWNGEQVELVEASVSHDEGGYFWTVRAQIAKAADYLRMRRMDPVTLDIYGDEYDLVIESLSRSRASTVKGGGTESRFEIVCRSVMWATLGPDAEPVTRTWATAQSARDIIEELAGEPVDWRIIDWIIPAGRLAAVNEEPISIISRIAAAAGGVVESDVYGWLIVRYRYPVSAPLISGADVAHDFSEVAGQISLSERQDARTVFNRLTLSDAASEQGRLSIERDPDQPNTILGGEQQKFLVYYSPDVEISQVIVSAGSVIDLGDADIEIDGEDVTFSNTDQAQAAKPVHGGFSYVWYGTGLGAITVGADGISLRAASSGVGIARIAYTARARRYALLSPSSAGGQTEFPIAVYVIGVLSTEPVASGKNVMRISVQRGAGERQGDDVVEPLAGNENVLLNRGRNEIDAAAAKAIVSLEVVYQSGESGSERVQVGELIAAEDSQAGSAWRGKVSAVEHRITRADGTTTALTVERFIA